MANIRITSLTANTTLAADDVFVHEDISTDTTSKITWTALSTNTNLAAADYLDRGKYQYITCTENTGDGLLEFDFGYRYGRHTLTQDLDLDDSTIGNAPYGEWRHLHVKGSGFVLTMPGGWVNNGPIEFKNTASNFISIIKHFDPIDEEDLVYFNVSQF